MSTNNGITIDVMLPYRGNFKLFEQTVDSLCNQTSKQWRLTVIDNSEYKEEVRKFIEKLNNPNIVLFENKDVLTIGANFQKALNLVQEEWFVIFGADDIMHRDFINQIIRIVEKQPPVAFLHSRVIPISRNGDAIPNYLPDRIKRLINPAKLQFEETVSSKKALRRLAIGNYLYFPGIVWRRSLLSKFAFREDLKIALDLDLEIAALINNKSYLQAVTPIIYYRRHEEGESFRVASKASRIMEEKLFYRDFARKCYNSGEFLTGLVALMAITVRLHGILNRLKRI